MNLFFDVKLWVLFDYDVCFLDRVGSWVGEKMRKQLKQELNFNCERALRHLKLNINEGSEKEQMEVRHDHRLLYWDQFIQILGIHIFRSLVGGLRQLFL